MGLSRESIQELSLLLRPHMIDELRAYLLTTLGNDIYSLNLNWNLSIKSFIPIMVSELVRYGTTRDSQPALCALMEVIREDVGEDVKVRIDELILRIRKELATPENLPNRQLPREERTPTGKKEQPKLDDLSPQFEPTGGADLRPTSEAIELFNQAQDIKEVSKQQAIDLFTQAINLSPNYYLAYYERGITYVEQRQYHQAIKDFDYAANLYSEDYNLYFSRAIVHRTLGDEQRAIKDYERVIELNPDEDKAYNNLGVIYAERGEYEKAIEHLNQGLQIVPMQAYKFLLNLAGAYIKAGKFHEAINTYDTFISQGHTDPTAYFYRGILYDRIREVEKAIQDLEEAYKLYAINRWSTEKALETRYLIKEIKAFGHIRRMPYISLSTWL